MSPKDQFIKSIQESLSFSRYSNRLTEELADHFDDLVYAEMIKGANEKTAIENTVNKLGPIKTIAQEYNTAMKFIGSSSLYLEAAMIGILSTPIYLLAVFIAPSSFATLWFIPLSAVIVILYYRITLVSLLRFVESRNILPYLIGLILGIPAITLFIILQVWNPIFMSSYQPSGALIPNHALIGLIGYLGILFICALSSTIFFSRQIYHAQLLLANGNTNKLKKAEGILAKYGPAIISILTIYATSMTTIVLWFPYSGEVSNLASAVGSIAIGPVLIFRMLPELIFNAGINFTSNPVVGYWIIGMIIAIISIVAIYRLVQYIYQRPTHKQPFPWFALAIATYGINLLLLCPPPQPTNIPWSIPAVKISAQIEQQQLGPFYRMAKYLNQKEGQYARYNIGSTESGFQIIQLNNRQFVLKNIQSISSFNLSGPIEFTGGDSNNFPAVRCFDFGTQTLIEASNVDMNSLQTCSKLLIGDKQIFDFAGAENYRLMNIKTDVTVSFDNQWALIVIGSNGYYDPDDVYLADLR